MGCHPRDHVATAVQNHETITPHRAGLGKGQPQDSKEGFYCERVAFARRESHDGSRTSRRARLQSLSAFSSWDHRRFYTSMRDLVSQKRGLLGNHVSLEKPVLTSQVTLSLENSAPSGQATTASPPGPPTAPF